MGRINIPCFSPMTNKSLGIFTSLCAPTLFPLYIHQIFPPNFKSQGQNRPPIPISHKVFRLAGLRRSEMATSTTSSGSSVSAFLWSLVINGLIFLAFFVGFLLVCTTRLLHVRKVLTSRFFSSGKSTSESMNRERSLGLYLKSKFI